MNKQFIFLNSHELKLLSYLRNNNLKKIFLVTGKNSFRKSGAYLFIENLLSLDDTLSIYQFSDFSPNPKLEDAKNGLDLYKKNKCDTIISIGGGSVMDMAKIIKAISNNNVLDIEKLVITNSLNFSEKSPLIAIPTTSGSGSESTSFAVVYINEIKYSIQNKILLPECVVLDYKLTLSANPYQIACSGLDALCQAIESYWSVNSTKISKQFSKDAIKIIFENLEQAVNNSENINAKKKMLLGANYAGKAINISKTTAPHAFSYSLTSKFKIPHGHAVLLSLPKFLNYNYFVSGTNCNDSRGPSYVKKTIDDILEIFNVKNPNEFIELIQKFASNIGVELNMNNLAISKEMIKNDLNVNVQRLSNNPRLLQNKNYIDFFIWR